MAFNPLRLTIARKRRLLNKKLLAQKLELANYTVVRWETGETVPTPDNISALVRLLRFPAAFFDGPDIDEAEKSTTSFRSQTSMSAAYRDAALAAGSLGFLISDWVEEKFNLLPHTLPDLHLYGPEEAAVTLRQEWGLGEKPISNMIQLLESRGARVFSLAENTATVNAYSLWRRSKPYVFLNTFKSAESSRFDAAHELGHLVMHQDGKVCGRPAEDQANRFASAFLMPSRDILAVIPTVNSINRIVAAKTRWKVSVAALNYRLHKLGLLTDWKYRDFCIEIAKAGFNRTEPNGIQRETSVVWDKVLKAMWREGTAPEDIAKLLSLPEGEFHSLLFGVLAFPNGPARDRKEAPSTPLTLCADA